jgi:hypothetical protein
VCTINAALALRRQEGRIDRSWPGLEPRCDFDAYECSVVVVCRQQRCVDELEPVFSDLKFGHKIRIGPPSNPDSKALEDCVAIVAIPIHFRVR